MQSGNRLKIAVVSETFLPEVNGVTRSLDRMIRGIKERGHRVLVFRPAQDSDGSPALSRALDSITGIRFSGIAKTVVPPKSPPAVESQSNRLEGEARDIEDPLCSRSSVHSRQREWNESLEAGEEHLCSGFRMPFYREVQVGLASPHFFRARFRKDRPDLVHIITEGPLGLTAMLAARSLGIPTISDYRTHFDQYFHYYGMASLGRRVSWYLRTFHNLTGRTLVPTRFMKDELTGAGFKRVSVIGRGVDTELYSPQHRSNRLRARYDVEGGLLVLYAGRLAPEKNIDLAIRSFRAIKEIRPEARMVLVGDGPDRMRLERENPDLYFTGFLSGQELSAHYASSDVFLFPSLTDTFGNVVTEAAASGLAILAYDRGAARELMDHGRSAWICSGDSDARYVSAARALAELSISEKSRFAELRRSALEVAEGASWDSVISRLEETYYEALVKKVRFRNRVQLRMRKSRTI